MQLNSLGEINTPSASQEIYWILWNPDIYCVYKTSPLTETGTEPDESIPH
jgi:hypothetical protein